MKGLKFIDKDIVDIQFSKNPEMFDGTIDLNMDVSMEYGLGIDEDMHHCYGDANVTISDENNMYFELNVHVIGIFSILNVPATKEEEDDLHNATAKELLPHISSIVASIAAMADVPAVPISYEDFMEGNAQSFTESLN